MQTIGWIGTGRMGIPMVTNLLKAGFSVKVYNRTPEKALPLIAAGAMQSSTAADLVRQSDVLFLMLSNGAAIKEVMEAEAGVLAAIQPEKTIIDMSTISPEESRKFANEVAEKGGRYIDAPVSGSVGAATAAQLVILAGALESELVPFHPYLDALGKKTIAFGGPGKGSSAKLAINLLLGVTGQAVAESLLLAEKEGIDRESMLELIGLSGMNTPWFQLKQSMYRSENFPAQFMLELMTKDLGLITAEAERLNLDLPLAEKAFATYSAAEDHGRGKLDMAAIYLELKQKVSTGAHVKEHEEVRSIMELFEALHTRRSIRKYQQKEIAEETVQKLLAAAMMAPSAGDERPWQFILVTDADKKAQIKAAHPYAGMMVNAPLGILICGDLSKQKYEGFWPQDCSAAMQNLLLAAHASGLGAVWTGIHPLTDRVEKFKEIFNLPGHVIPFGLAVVGWPDQSPKTVDRFDPSRVHSNTWEER